jgi:hypothetical protein
MEVLPVGSPIALLSLRRLLDKYGELAARWAPAAVREPLAAGCMRDTGLAAAPPARCSLQPLYFAPF